MRRSSRLEFLRANPPGINFFLRVITLIALSSAFAVGVRAANNPVPFVSIVSPVSVNPGATGVTLTVRGTGFVPSSVIGWNGKSLSTTFVSSRELTASVPDASVAAVGVNSVIVVSPAPGGGKSGAVFVPVATVEASAIFPSMPASSVNVGAQPQQLLAADFNGDGKADLVVANRASGNVSILLSNGDGTFTTKSTPSAGSGAASIAAGDFNEDGKLDLAVANSGSMGAGGIGILLGNGDGTFTLGPSSNTGSGPVSIVAGDFNGDGHLDIAVSNQNDGTVTILLGAGDGSFSAGNTLTVGPSPQAVVAGDFNEDGHLDLAVSNKNDGTVSVLLGIGDGTFQSQSIFSTGGSGQPTALIAGDYNADGHLDLTAVNASDVGILLGNGNGQFTLHANPGSGTSDLVAGVAGDYNADGKLDLMLSDRAGGKAALLAGNGDGTFTAAQLFTTAAGAYGLAAGDFDGDGALDIAVASGTSNNISIFLQSLPVDLNPTSLAFGNIRVGLTSGSQPVTLTNNSGGALNVTSIGFTGAGSGDFSQNNTCGISVSNNSACTINSAFTPTASGARAATLTIVDNASSSPQTLAVSGFGTVPPSITSANHATFDVRVAGSFIITTTGFPAPSLSEAGPLPAGLTFIDNGDGTATLSGTSNSGTDEVDVLIITAHNGIGPDATQVFTLTVASPPIVAKAFGAAAILINDNTSLTFTITDPNIGVTLTGVAFTDNLPAGLFVSTPSNLSTTCVGVVSAAAGAPVVSLSSGILGPRVSCTLSLDVTGTTGGIKNNSVQATSANEGAGNTSTASITVVAPPTISKAFNPTSIALNGGSTLSFILTNANAGNSLSGVSFADNLPAGVVIAAVPNVTGSCGSGVITAAGGSSFIRLSGGTLNAAPAAGSSCTFSVDVVATSAGIKSNTTGTVASIETGSGATSNTAILTVVAPPSIAKSFSPTSIALNANTSLTFTISNSNPVALAGVAFTDTLPAGLTVANSAATPCGGTLTAATPRSIALAGATIAANSQCVFSVTVAGATSGDFTNTTGSVTSTNGGTGNTASANLTVAGPPTITKSFAAPTVVLNGTIALTFNITNPNTTASLSGIAFTDNLPAGMLVAAPTGVTSTCGGAIVALANASSISLSGGALAAGASCAVSINVTATTAGVKTNSVQVTSTSGGTGNISCAGVTIVAPPTILKSFGAASIALNASTSLTFTVRNNDAATTLTGMAFTDTLPSGLVISTPNGLAGACGGGAITTAQGTGVIRLSGATLAPNSSCSFALNVTGIAAGDQNNTTGNLISANGGMGGAASATIKVIGPPVIAEGFAPTSIALGASTTLTFTLTNPPANTAALTGVSFTDTFPVGLALANSTTSICGGTLTTTAPETIALSGAALSIGGQCAFSVAVTGAASGTYTNATGPVTSTNGGTGNDATAVLTVATPPIISEAFSSASIGLANSTTLHFTITNPNAAVALTGVAFTDRLPAGLVVSTPNGAAGTCGNGIVAAVVGTQRVSLAGGTIAAGAACTFSVNVTGTSAGNQVNSTGVVSALNGGIGNTAFASIYVLAPDLTISKTHTGNFFQGQTGASYSLTVNNIGAGPTAGAITITDTLPAGISTTALGGTGWICILANLSCARSDALGAGASYPAILLTVDVATNAALSVTNRAVVSGGGELNTTNDSAADLTTITLPPDFSISATQEVTIRAGQQASYTVTVTPLNNAFANQVAFSAGGLPLRTSCIFNPSPVTPNASAATSALLVSTTGGDAFVAGNSESNRRPLYALLAPFAGLVLSSRAFRRGRSKKKWQLIVLLLVCGGLGWYGCTGVAGNFQRLSTPPGTYVVTITANSGNLQHSAQVTLIVQP